jgi:hypothetical protein
MTDQTRIPRQAFSPCSSAPSQGRGTLADRAGGGAESWLHLSTPVAPLPPIAEPIPTEPVLRPQPEFQSQPQTGPEVTPAPEAKPAPVALDVPLPGPGPFHSLHADFPAPALQTQTQTGVAVSGIEGRPATQVFRGTFHAIDRRHLREQGLLEPEGPVTELLEEFRIIKRQLLLAAAGSRAGRGLPRGERILVSSALPGEGRRLRGQSGAVDGGGKGYRSPSGRCRFRQAFGAFDTGASRWSGAAFDALSDPQVAVEDCILGTDIPGLFVLPAGNASGVDTELLASAHTSQVLARLTAHSPNRIVIFDSSPVLAASPASELALHVGQTVMVVRADMTGEAALRDAINLLSGCADIKLLLNATRFSPTGRRFGTYYGYKE